MTRMQGTGMVREELEDLAQEALAVLLANRADRLMPMAKLTVNGESVGALSTFGVTKLEGEVLASDTKGGQVFILAAGMVEAAWTPLAMRMRFVNGDLVEAEVLLGPGQTGLCSDADKLRESDLIYAAPIAPHRRAGPEDLRRIAATYWQARSASTETIPFDRRCDIYINGAKFTNTLRTLLLPGVKLYDCQALVKEASSTVASLRDLRFPVIDAELGLIAGFVTVEEREASSVFGQSGGTSHVACLMKIVDHSIRCVDEVRCAISAGSSAPSTVKER